VCKAAVFFPADWKTDHAAAKRLKGMVEKFLLRIKCHINDIYADEHKPPWFRYAFFAVQKFNLP
jgi:hypothetical protein